MKSNITLKDYFEMESNQKKEKTNCLEEMRNKLSSVSIKLVGDKSHYNNGPMCNQ